MLETCGPILLVHSLRAHGDDGVRFGEYRTQSPVVPFRDNGHDNDAAYLYYYADLELPPQLEIDSET